MTASSRAPLLFIDLNTLSDFFDPGAPMLVRGAERVRAGIRDLLRIGSRCGVIVLAGVDTHLPGDPEFTRLPTHALQGQTGQKKIFETSVRGAILVPPDGQRRPWPNLQQVRDRNGQIILEKRAFDLFSNPAAAELLRALETRELVVYGATLEHDVLATVVSARQHGYEVTVAIDAVGTRNEDAALSARGALGRRGARLQPAAEIVTRLTLWKKRLERERRVRATP